MSFDCCSMLREWKGSRDVHVPERYCEQVSPMKMGYAPYKSELLKNPTLWASEDPHVVMYDTI